MAGTKKEYSLGFIIGATIDRGFPGAFKSAQRHIAATKKAARNAGKAWADFGASAGKLVLGVTAAATGVAAAVWKMTDAVGEQGNRAYLYSRKIGMTAEAYQELEYAFNQSGIAAGQFGYMMRRLDTTISTAASSTERADRFAEEFGLSAEKLANMNPERRIERLIEYLNYLEDPLERDRIALELFGRSGAEMARLMEIGAGGIQELREEARRTGNVMSNEAAAQANAYASMKEQLRTTVNGVKVQLFSGLLPIFTEVMGNITERIQAVDWAAMGERIVEWVRDFIPKVQEFGQRAGEFIMKIRDGVLAVKEFLGGWRNTAKLVGVLMLLPTAIKLVKAMVATFKLITPVTLVATKAQVGFNIAMKANPIGIIILAIIALIAGIVLLIRNWDRVKEVFIRVWEAIRDFFARIVDWIRSKFQAWIQFQINLLIRIRDFFVNVWEAIKGFFSGIVDWIREKFRALIQFQIDLLIGIRDFFINVWESIKGVWSVVTDFFSGIFSGAWEAIKSAWSGVTGFFSGIWSGIVNGARGMVNSVINVVNGLIKGFLTPFNFIIKGLNKIPGVNIPELSLSIPQLAKGGIFDRPMIAQIAEAGDAEAVVPLNNKPRSRAIWETAGQMAGFTSGGGSGGDSISISVPINIGGNADESTVKQIQSAAQDVAAIVRRELEAVQKKKARLSFA